MKSSTNDKPHSPGQALLKTRRFGVSLVCLGRKMMVLALVTCERSFLKDDWLGCDLQG